MLVHTLIIASLSTMLTVGISIVALLVAGAALFFSYTKIQEQTGRLSKYSNMSKFNQLQIGHHENRLLRLEKKLKINSDPMVEKGESQ